MSTEHRSRTIRVYALGSSVTLQLVPDDLRRFLASPVRDDSGVTVLDLSSRRRWTLTWAEQTRVGGPSDGDLLGFVAHGRPEQPPP